MAEVREVELPGIGIRHDFVTSEGEKIGVLVRNSGRCEVAVYGQQDPDAARVVLRLDEDDSRTLGELLGAVRLAESLVAMQHQVRDLAIDWVPVEPGSRIAGRTLADSAVHSRTGVSVVAILRGDDTIAAPGAEHTLESGDTVVAVGSTSGMRQFLELLAP